MNSNELRTPRWMIERTIGAIVLATAMIGVATVLITDRDAGLSNSDVVTSLRCNLRTFSESGFPVRVAILETPDAAETIPSLIPILNREHRLEYHTVNAESIRDGVLENADVLLVPGGRGSFKGKELGDAGRLRIREFVQRGGGYVGICGGAFLAASGQDWSLELVGSRPLVGVVPCGAKGAQSMTDRGSGTVWVQLSSLGQGLLSMTDSPVPLRYTSGPVFGGGFGSELAEFVVLARYDSELVECELQRYTMIHRPAIIAAHYGSGHVMLFSPHPEMSPQCEHWLIEAIASCTTFRRT